MSKKLTAEEDEYEHEIEIEIEVEMNQPCIDTVYGCIFLTFVSSTLFHYMN